MPRYIIEREMGEIDMDTLPDVGKKSSEVVEGMEGVVWVRSYISEAEGKIYCEYEAPNPEAVYEHARRVGLPVTRISEVAMEVDPSMFR
ncbi:MAG TPA: DUF4242 domain-containing protein [Longimicrobiales bacterium]|nr:DUF4242 domain-containing protein [Longimicrobiales bacterium]